MTLMEILDMIYSYAGAVSAANVKLRYDVDVTQSQLHFLI